MAGGCKFDEGLNIKTMEGKVVVPRAARLGRLRWRMEPLKRERT